MRFIFSGVCAVMNGDVKVSLGARGRIAFVSMANKKRIWTWER